MPLSNVGKPERHTQNRIIALFRDDLGYRYLDDWSERDGNSNVEKGLLTALEEKLAKARLLKLGRMQELLTGNTHLV